jgi:hypothetical protein
LCDDFENGFLRWTGSYTSTGSLLDSPVRPRTPTHSLEADASPTFTASSAANVYLDIPRRSTGMIAVRMWVSTPQPLINFDSILVVIDPGAQYVAVGADTNGTWTVTETVMTSLVDVRGTTSLPIDTWTCVELDYRFPDSGNSFELFVDDAIAVASNTSIVTPSFTRVVVGIARADIAGYHVFIDDVVIATQHIGCS